MNIIEQHASCQTMNNEAAKVEAISLCTGIGAWDASIIEAGFNIRLQVERDEKKLAVLQAEYPTIHKDTDIKNITKARLINYEINPREIAIFAGLPCQPLSVAGPQLGRESSDWLWNEYVRIIKDCQPRCTVLENVKGAVRHEDGLPYLRTQMARLKYHEWFSAIIPASAFEAPHERYRLFSVFGRDQILSDAAGIRRYEESLSFIKGPKIINGQYAGRSIQQPGLPSLVNGHPRGFKKELLQEFGNAVEHETGLFIANAVYHYIDFWYNSEIGKRAIKHSGN